MTLTSRRSRAAFCGRRLGLSGAVALQLAETRSCGVKLSGVRLDCGEGFLCGLNRLGIALRVLES